MVFHLRCCFSLVGAQCWGWVGAPVREELFFSLLIGKAVSRNQFGGHLTRAINALGLVSNQ